MAAGKRMTAEVWSRCDDPEWMSDYVWNKFSRTKKSFLRRKMRLLACACYRRVEHLMNDPRSREAIRLGELNADGLLSEAAVRSARSSARAADRTAATAKEEFEKKFANPRTLWYSKPFEALLAASDAAYAATQVFNIDGGIARAYVSDALQHERLARPGTRLTIKTAQEAENEADRALVEILRDLFGNPLRPVSLDPAWLRWNDGTVVKLARGIYDEQALDRLPILADALEEAGCSNPEVLSHCRGPGPHVRGCWVLDLLLNVG
jgi:hypothetical protein